MSQRSRETFRQLVTLPDQGIPLAETALLIACEEYPQLEIRPYLDELDGLADRIRQTIRPEDSALDRFGRINDVLYGEMGFRGNTDNYYDPRNSFLNEVLERRTGIPITLSTIYLEVARRLDLPMAGVGMPGHFLVKYASPEWELFIDPFNGGEILTHDGCRERLAELFGDSLPFSERYLARLPNRQIVSRMLNNLRHIYLKAESVDKVLAVIDLMIIVEPEQIEAVRDRGLVLARLRRFEEAIKSLEAYVKAAPDAGDRADIEEQLRELKRIRVMMN